MPGINAWHFLKIFIYNTVFFRRYTPIFIMLYYCFDIVNLTICHPKTIVFSAFIVTLTIPLFGRCCSVFCDLLTVSRLFPTVKKVGEKLAALLKKIWRSLLKITFQKSFVESIDMVHCHDYIVSVSNQRKEFKP